jgi:uncharacterized protein with NRDE domain
MCTVTFIARKNGYALGMNRDEKLSRVQGLPPAKHLVNGRAAMFPSEPGGGTWIGVSDAGVTFALINWYSVTSRVSHNVLSRGEVTRALLASDDLLSAEEYLARFQLKRTNPFRVIGVFPQNAAVVEWRWNLSALERVTHDWKPNIWISSGFDEPGADNSRRETFTAAMRSPWKKNSQWLRRLHSSHAPTASPYSICMHRDDAASISYTEIEVDKSSAKLAHVAGPLCQVMPGSVAWQSQFCIWRR